MSSALPPRASTAPSRRSTLFWLESSKGPNCRLFLTSSSVMDSGPGNCLSEMFNYSRAIQACVPDRHELASALYGSFAQKNHHVVIDGGTLASQRCLALPSRQQRSYTLVTLGTPRTGEDSWGIRG